MRRLILAGIILLAPFPATADAAPVAAPHLWIAFTPSSIVFGGRAVAHGRIAPARAGIRVAIERKDGSRWRFVESASTDSAGRFNARLRPGRSGVWRARIATASSPAVRLAVIPRLQVRTRPGIAFVGASILIRARPRTPSPALVTVLRNGREIAHARGRAGRRILVPTPGVGTFTARVELAGGTASVRLRASARALSPGSSGPDVAALRARLAQLRVHVPGPSATFGSELFDAVVAFQKARGLPRTGIVDPATWRALSQDAVPAPRYRGAGTHLEVSKSRQILMVVRDGRTAAYVPVSSGAGGITPVGDFSVLWKAPSTTTWLGSAILYRTMTIHGNVAIHGYPSVPTYPASHGCVRVPIWVADWLYEQTPVGERVYVYE